MSFDFRVRTRPESPCTLYEDGIEAGEFPTEEDAKAEAQVRYEQDIRYWLSQHTEE